jgi:ParB-like chromosome segregation protein Spo0J
MEYRRIELGSVLQQGPDSERYVFTHRPDLADLSASIGRLGLLTAPVLQEDPQGFFRVVCGSRRIKALRCLGWRSLQAFVASAGEMTDTRCLSRSILENLWHRGFNEVEKALLFTRLTDRYLHLLPDLSEVLDRDLRVPQGAEALEPYRFLLSLPGPILDSVARGELGLTQVLLFRRLPGTAHPGFFRILTECGLTSQEARKATEWIREVARREEREAAVIIDEANQELIGDAGDPRSRARHLFSFLSRRRYPLLESWKARFASARSQLSEGDEGIGVSHDPTFETTEIKVQVRAASEPEFRQRLAALSEALKEGKIRKLFEALSVKSGDFSKKEPTA